jgi:hypothetical protein
MASRNGNDVRVPVDNFWIETIKVSVSGTGVGDMTGSVYGGTQLNAVVTFPSGTSPGYAFTLPSGSVRVDLPGGGGVNLVPNGRYSQVMAWHVQMEASGTDAATDARSTVNAFDVRKYGHSADSGSFVFGFVRASGSITNGGNIIYKGTVPEDRINPASPAATVHLTFFGRNSNRRA